MASKSADNFHLTFTANVTMSLLSHAGNFMLVNDHDKAPLKAIDFGLAATFTSADEPRSDLGLEGTAW